MSQTIEQRVRFLASHWNDSMGWKAIPFWCVVAFAGAFAQFAWQYQVAVLAAGAAFSWLWSRGLSPWVESRVGVMRKPSSATSKGQWKRAILLWAPFFAAEWALGTQMEGQPRTLPIGWMENNLSMFLSVWFATSAFQVIDATNPWARRTWYLATLLLWAAEQATLGYGPMTYGRGYFVFGMTQCAVAASDLALVFQMAKGGQRSASIEVVDA